MSHKIKLVSEPVEITKAELGDDGQPKGPPSFAGVAYSGGLVPGYTAIPPLPHDYVIDLAGTKNARTIHANLDHVSAQRVGHVTDAPNDGQKLRVAGLLSAETSYRDEVAGGARNGQPWEVSIEGRLAGKKFIPKGQSAVVNGRTLNGPFFRMTDNTFTDIAFVSHGADGDNEVRIAASAAGESKMTEFEKFALSCGVDLAAITDEQKTALQTAHEAQAKLASGQPKPEIKSFEEQAAQAEKDAQRVQKIQTMALQAMNEHKTNPHTMEQIKACAKLAIDRGMDEDHFELELLRSTRMKTGTFTTRSHTQSSPKVIEAALSMSCGLTNIEKYYASDVLDAAHSLRQSGFSLQSMLLESACDNGYVCGRVPRIHNGNIREVLEYAFPPATARLGGFSTIALPGILGNVANKQILEGYMEEDNTWTEISRIRNVSNFHTHTYYRMTDDLEYEELGPAGEIKHGTLGQESYTVQAKTYAKMLGLNRTQIVNDDLGAFDDLRERLGRGGAKKFNNIVWATFINNSSHYTSARGNVISGGTSVLDINGTGLQLGITAYRKLKSPSSDGQKRVGNALGRPTKLLVPPELEFIALRMYQSTLVNTGGSSSNDTIGNSNIHAGLYRPIVQDRLSDSAFTGYSTTAWYLLGNTYMPVAVSFLNGQQTPTIESADADFNTLGIQFRGYHDFGADLGEYMSVKSAGA